MNGKKAREIRRIIYEDGDYPSNARGRRYFRGEKSGMIIADERRRKYQNAKKAYKEAS